MVAKRNGRQAQLRQDLLASELLAPAASASRPATAREGAGGATPAAAADGGRGGGEGEDEDEVAAVGRRVLSAESNLRPVKVRSCPHAPCPALRVLPLAPVESQRPNPDCRTR